MLLIFSSFEEEKDYQLPHLKSKKKKEVFELKLAMVFQAIIIKLQSSVPSKEWVSVNSVSLISS